MSLSTRRLKEAASLQKKKYRDKLGEFIIEGVRALESAVDAGAAVTEVILDMALEPDERLNDLLARLDVEVARVDSRSFDRLSDVKTSQGVIAVVEKRLVEPAELLTGRRIMALDAVQDPGNAGTLVRTAAWFGVDGVVVGPGTVDLHNPKTVRAAMGGHFEVSLSETESLVSFLEAARSSGWSIAVADIGGKAAGSWQPAIPSVLVVGNEAHGISDSVLQVADERVRIEGGGVSAGVESLNVAQAASILTYLWTR